MSKSTQKKAKEFAKRKKEERQIVRIVLIGTLVLMVLIYLAYKNL